MAEPISAATKPEVTRTGALRVACTGPSWGPHPKVFLSVQKNAQGQPTHVVCPYCSHVFQFDPHLAKHASH